MFLNWKLVRAVRGSHLDLSASDSVLVKHVLAMTENKAKENSFTTVVMSP